LLYYSSGDIEICELPPEIPSSTTKSILCIPPAYAHLSLGKESSPYQPLTLLEKIEGVPPLANPPIGTKKWLVIHDYKNYTIKWWNILTPSATQLQVSVPSIAKNGSIALTTSKTTLFATFLYERLDFDSGGLLRPQTYLAIYGWDLQTGHRHTHFSLVVDRPMVLKSCEVMDNLLFIDGREIRSGLNIPLLLVCDLATQTIDVESYPTTTLPNCLAVKDRQFFFLSNGRFETRIF
jgi:hypothetical protein